MNYKRSIFGKVPKGWTLSNIGEIVELRQGLQISKKYRKNSFHEGYIPLLKITDLPSKKFSEFVTNIKEQYIANKDDIIYTRTGQVGLVYTDVEGCVHNNCFKVIVDYSKFDKDFIYYLLNNKIFRDYSNLIASGSVQKDLTHKSFKTITIAYPTLNEQRQIGKILRTLEEKININNKIIKTLDEIAQIIFKRWFVNFEFPNKDGKPYKLSGGGFIESDLGIIPDGWKTGKFKDININFDSRRIPLSKLDREKRNKIYAYYGAASLMDYVDDYIFDGSFILMGEDGTVVDKEGYPILQYVWGKFWVNNHAHVLQGKPPFSNEYMYLLLKNTNVNSIITGAVQPKINQKNLNSLRVIIPNKETLNQFDKVVLPLFEKKKNLSDQNINLIEIRDTLIPKLISGAIRINQAEKEVKECLQKSN